jgi:hypothetical protein
MTIHKDSQSVPVIADSVRQRLDAVLPLKDSVVLSSPKHSTNRSRPNPGEASGSNCSMVVGLARFPFIRRVFWRIPQHRVRFQLPLAVKDRFRACVSGSHVPKR